MVVDILKQLFISYATTQITQIIFFWRNLVVLNILYWTKMMHLWLKHSYLHWISLNDFNGKENALISESKIDCIIIKKRFIVPILWFHVSKSSLFLKTLIDCVLLNVHHQGYVVRNLFLLIFFIFVCIIFIEKNMELYSYKKSSSWNI